METPLLQKNIVARVNSNRTTPRLPQRVQESVGVLLLNEDEQHAEAVQMIAEFIASAHPRKQLACIDLLFPGEDPLSQVYLLAFCFGTEVPEEWIAFTLTAYPVIWEIRAVCQHLLEKQRRNNQNSTWRIVQSFCWESQSSLLVLDKLMELHLNHHAMQASVLCSLAYLRERAQTKKEEPAKVEMDQAGYNHAIQHVAYYLANRAVADEPKLQAISFLIGNYSEARLCLDFVRELDTDTTQFQNEQSFLLWELRALCLHQQELQSQNDEHVLQAANVAAECITDTATVVTNMLSGTSKIASHGMQTASRLVVEHTEPAGVAAEPPPAEAVAVTGAVHRATDKARQWTASASQTVRVKAAQHLHSAATHVPVPPQHAAALQAAAHVAMACVGATAVVGEAVFAETGNLCTSATEAVSSIVQHKCGDAAGEITNHVGNTVGNVFRTASHVALFTGGGLPRSVVKSTGKWHITSRGQEDKLEDDDETSSVVVSVGKPSEDDGTGTVVGSTTN